MISRTLDRTQKKGVGRSPVDLEKSYPTEQKDGPGEKRKIGGRKQKKKLSIERRTLEIERPKGVVTSI